MKEKKSSKAMALAAYAILAAITLCVMLIILVMKGIWPFGAGRIDYFDNMQQVAPLYAHLWDWLHGEAALSFDWYTGLGTNVSMSISAFSMLSPFNLLLYLIPRNLILESISIFTMVKMMCMSVTMYAYLNKVFRGLSYRLKVTFSLMYAFCGYTLLYASCFTPWMDIVAIFPLIMLGYHKMMETGRKLLYIFMVALAFIINYYLSAMSLVYILLVSAAFIIIKAEKSTWKEHIFNLGIGTVAGVGLSSFVLVPVFMQLGSSQRGSSGAGILSQYAGWITSSIATEGAMASFQRWAMLLGMSFAIAVIIFGIKRSSVSRKDKIYTIVLAVIALSPMFIEAVNLMWHFGSYNGYTLRNGYLIAFTLITLAAFYAQDLFCECENGANGADNKKYFWIYSSAAVIVCLAFAYFYNHVSHIPQTAATVFVVLMVILMSIYHVYGLSKSCMVKLTVVAAEVFIAAYALVGPPKFYDYAPYQHGDYVQLANGVKEDLDITESVTDRIINPDLSLNANYPLILRRGALSSFTAALAGDTQASAYNLGYSKYFLWLLDSGGTVFTNALFNITEAVNVNELDSDIYTFVKKYGDYSLYKTNYNLPFANCVSSSFVQQDFDGDWIKLHNMFYHELSGSNEDLATGLGYSVYASDNYRQYESNITGKKALYLSVIDEENEWRDANSQELFYKIKLYVNGEAVTVPTIGDVKNTSYMTDYNNNLIYLGCFEDEKVDIKVEIEDGLDLNDYTVKLGQIDMRKLEALTENLKGSQRDIEYTDNSLTVNVKGNAEKDMLLVPVINSGNWNITVNGKTTEGLSVAGMFTGVALENGDNTVEFKFEAKGAKEGFIITAAILIIILVCVIINHYRKIKVPVIIKCVAEYIYLALCAVLVIAMFLVPAVIALPVYIYKIAGVLKGLF